MFPSVIYITVLVAAIENYDIEKNYVAVKTVLWNTDKLNCHICDEILEGLEDIDDECDVYGIHLVKIQDPQLAKRYSIKTFPALVYFRNGNPLLYEGKMYLSVAWDSWFILLISCLYVLGFCNIQQYLAVDILQFSCTVVQQI